MKTKMKNIITNFALIILMILIQSQLTFSQEQQEQQKLAQTGMKFLNVSLDARASAFGDAVTSIESNNSSAMFYNPASMARFEGIADVTLGSTQFIADINYYNAAVAFAPEEGDYGVFGFSFVSVDYGDFMGTVRADNEQGFLDVGSFSPTAMAIGFGYANALSEKFSVGANIKYVRQSLGSSIVGDVVTDPSGAYAGGTTEENELDVISFDFGVLYKTGFESLNLGMSVRNFAREVKYKKESFQLPLIFQLGASFNFSDVLDLDKNEHSILLTVDANHPRDYPEQILVGVEYTFMGLVSFRGGYSAPNDERNISAGLGLKKDIGGLTLGVDYAYTPFGVFNDVHRLSLNFAY
jgi:hypothetical protein